MKKHLSLAIANRPQKPDLSGAQVPVSDKHKKRTGESHALIHADYTLSGMALHSAKPVHLYDFYSSISAVFGFPAVLLVF